MNDVVSSVWKIAGPSRLKVVRGAVLRAVQTAFSGAVYLSLAWLIVTVASGRDVTHNTATVITVIAVGSLVAQLVVAYLAARDSWLAAYEVSAHIRIAVLDHLLRVPMATAGERRRGELASLLASDLQRVEEFFSEGLPKLGQAVGLPLVVIVAVAVHDPIIAGVTAATVAVVFPIIVWSGTRVATSADRLLEQQAEASARFVDVVTGVTVRRILATTDETTEFTDKAAQSIRDTSVGLVRERVWPLMVASIVTMVGVVVVMLTGVGRGGDGTTIALVATMAVYPPLLGVHTVGEMWYITQAAMTRIHRIMCVDTLSVPDTPAIPDRYDVQFDAVGYHYPDGTEALHNVTVSVEERTMIAVVGQSGAGKTSLIGLLSRFDDPTMGNVKIGGVDVRDMDAETVATTVTHVFQETHLLTGTVAENIALGRPDATGEEIQAAAKKARIHDHIQALPDGYQTVLGENGAGLSGGQRQRIAIARAILVDAPIMVLDEPTSALDTVTELEVAETVDALVQERTVFLIAHRLATTAAADEIIVLADGRVVQRGTFAELTSTEGPFKDMWAAEERDVAPVR